MLHPPKRILISRTDAIGDVILTLPLATILHQHFRDAHIGFLGRKYTEPVISCCSAVDEYVDMDDFLSGDDRQLREAWDTIIHVFPRKKIALKAASAGIANRIGTRNRAYHWLSCNRLIALSRKNSQLHEAQLNAVLLKPLGITRAYTVDELGGMFALNRLPILSAEAEAWIEPGRPHLILHPKSAGSAREWGLENFVLLAKRMAAEGFQIFISGSEQEHTALRPLLDMLGADVINIAGRLSLKQFIAFIARCDGLVAASTGPLHIAAALGKTAVGLYPPIRPMHAGRWGPIGRGAHALTLHRECSSCRKNPQSCTCISAITVEEVAKILINDAAGKAFGPECG